MGKQLRGFERLQNPRLGTWADRKCLQYLEFVRAGGRVVDIPVDVGIKDRAFVIVEFYEVSPHQAADHQNVELHRQQRVWAVVLHFSEILIISAFVIFKSYVEFMRT